MVDSWPASVRLWRNPWSQYEEDDLPVTPPHREPIGLEAWKPPEPPTYGITYREPEPEPYADFARSWLKPIQPDPNWVGFEIQPYPNRLGNPEQGPRAAVEAVSPRSQSDGIHGEVPSLPLGAFVMPGVGGAAAAGAGTSAAGVGASVAGAAGEVALPAGGQIGRAAVAGAASTAAAPLAFAGTLLTPTNSQNRAIDLGDGRRLVWPNSSLHFELEKSDGGILNAGFLQSWRPTSGSVRDELRNHPELSLDKIQKAFSDEGVALALLTMRSDARDGETTYPLRQESSNGTDAQNSRSQDGRKPVASFLDDYFSRRALRRQPDLVQRDTDGASLDPLDITFGDPTNKKVMDEIFAAKLDPEERAKQRAAALVGLSDEQRERMEACWEVQRLLNEREARQYRGENGQETAVGVTMPPDLHESTAGFMRDSQNVRHRNGMIGEYHVTNALRRARPGEHIIHFVNKPGAQGPDILSIGPDDNLMSWEAKFREQSQPVGPSMAQRPRLEKNTVRSLLEREVEAGRLEPDRAERVWENLQRGNVNFCTAGTGNAFGGWVELLRNHKTIVKAR